MRHFGSPEVPRSALGWAIYGPFGLLAQITWIDARALRVLKRNLMFVNYAWPQKRTPYRHEFKRYAERYL